MSKSNAIVYHTITILPSCTKKCGPKKISVNRVLKINVLCMHSTTNRSIYLNSFISRKWVSYKPLIMLE